MSRENRTFNSGNTESFRKIPTAEGPSQENSLTKNAIIADFIHLTRISTSTTLNGHNSQRGILWSQITAAGLKLDPAMSSIPAVLSPPLLFILTWMTAHFYTHLHFIQEDKNVFYLFKDHHPFLSAFMYNCWTSSACPKQSSTKWEQIRGNCRSLRAFVIS